MRLNGVDVRDATLESVQQRIGVVTQEAHLFHDTLRANLVYARPEPRMRRSVKHCATRRSSKRSRRFPTGSTRWSASAATVSPAAKSSGSRSRGCC